MRDNVLVLQETVKKVADTFRVSECESRCVSVAHLLNIISREKGLDINQYTSEVLDRYKEIDECLVHLTQIELAILTELSEEGIPIAFWMHLIKRSQQIWAIYDSLKDSHQYVCLWFNQHNHEIFINVDKYWHIPDGFFYTLKFIPVLFAIDTPLPKDLPHTIRRVAVAHGLHEFQNASLGRHRVEECAYYADYYFSPVPMEKTGMKDPIYLPKEVIGHASKSFTIVSAGYSSFDKLHCLCQHVPIYEKNYIVFHISPLSFLDVTIEEIDQFLSELCGMYPQYVVLFRPSMEEIELPLSSEKENFEYDRSPSYHEKYSKCRVFIGTAYNPSETYRTFSMAAEIPPILYAFKPISKTKYDIPVFVSATMGELKRAVDTILGNPGIHREELINTRNRAIANVGRTQQMIGRYLEAIVSGDVVPNSVSTKIEPLPEIFDREERYLMALMLQKGKNSQRNFGVRTKDLFQNSVVFNIGLAVVNARYLYNRIILPQNDQRMASFIFEVLDPLVKAAENVHLKTNDEIVDLLASLLSKDGLYLNSLLTQVCEVESKYEDLTIRFGAVIRRSRLKDAILAVLKKSIVSGRTGVNHLSACAPQLLQGKSLEYFYKLQSKGE